MWMSKKHNLVKTSGLFSEFTALNITVKLAIVLQYKLHMFRVPLEGPFEMLCDNESVFNNTSTPESVLIKKYHRITYRKCREAVAALICRISKEDIKTNL